MGQRKPDATAIHFSGRMHHFDTFEHAADIGLAARGATLEELFTNAAMGLVDLMVEPAGLQDAIRLEVNVRATDRDALLVAWLNELLYLLDSQRFLPRRCLITRMTGTELDAELWGDHVDPGRHSLRRLVKAATYHGLQISRHDHGWESRVILDL
jgi:SHS2 domain-containing protein